MLKNILALPGKIQQYIFLLIVPSDSHNSVISTKSNFKFLNKTVYSSDIFHLV